ncbi:hypothetical protein MMC30_003666 [Trapelia coarctata]|nr:hypothetical protein [Trapelia coarctata]
MSSRRVIRDSDDDDDDAGLSPQKHSPDPGRQMDITAFVDLGSSPPADAGFQVQSEHDRSTGSTELLSQAIRDAHQILLEPSPDTMPPALRSVMTSMPSPTMSKIQRRKTTMEAFSFTSSASKTKSVKTYGGNRNRVYEESDEETILLVPPSQKKKNLKRRATTGLGSTPGDETTLPPVTANRHSQQGHVNGSVSSTIPNTSIEPPRSLDLVAPDPSTSSARMTTPTISTRSPHDLSVGSTGRVKEPQNNFQEDEQQPSSYVAAETYTMTEVLIDNRITGSSYESRDEGRDELALPSSAHGHPASRQPKSQSKRRLSVGTYADELGSDDFAIGLPKEHYQPRPSRSRAGKPIDDIFFATDCSKRPEATARKIKRRKTTGMQLGREDENHQAMTDFPASTMDGVRRPQKTVNEDTITTDHKPEEQCRGNENVAPPLDEDQVPAREAVPVKKKRGRPKKQVDQVIEEKHLNGVQEPNAALEETAETSAPAKKPRKRRKTAEETAAISEDTVVEDDEEPNDGTHVEDHTLEANDNAANMRSEPLLTAGEPPKLGQEECSAQGQVTPPVETPKKQPSKGPTKHSPLNTGKIQYRVGLSKRMRIEPLLKVVRK